MQRQRTPEPDRPLWLTWFLSAILGVPFLSGCGGGGPPSPLPSVPAAIVAEQNPIAASLALWLAETVLKKVLDDVAFDVKRHEVKTDLNLLSSALARTNQRLAEQVKDIQQQLDAKVTRDEIRQLMETVIAQIESELRKAESQVRTIEDNVKELDQIISYVPTVTPSPLLRPGVDGRPEAHQLTVKWASLLSRSHVHWIEMEKLHRIYRDNADEMQAAVTIHTKLRQDTASLREEIRLELAKLLVERMKHLKTKRVTHPDVENFDASIASLTWLAKIAQIDEGGRYEGMFVVPADLVGPAASDILATFALAGADSTAVVPLYRKLVPVFATPPEHPEAKRPEPKREEPKLEPEGVFEARLLPSDVLRPIAAKYVVMVRDAHNLHLAVSDTDKQIREFLIDHSAQHPTIVNTLQPRKTELLVQLRQLNAKADALLNEAIAGYLTVLQTHRPTHPQQLFFAASVLAPLNEIYERSVCFDWTNSVAAEKTWSSYCAARKYIADFDWYVLDLDAHSAARKHAEEERELQRKREEQVREAERKRREGELAHQTEMRKRENEARKQERQRLVAEIKASLTGGKLIDMKYAAQKLSTAGIDSKEVTDRQVIAALQAHLRGVLQIQSKENWNNDTRDLTDLFETVRLLTASHEALGADVAEVLHFSTDGYTTDQLSYVKIEAMKLLADMGPAGKAAVPRLREPPKKTPLEVRLEAARAIYHIQRSDREVIATFQEALRSDESSYRPFEILNEVDSPPTELLPDLIQLLEHSSPTSTETVPTIRVQLSIKLLGKYGSKAANALPAIRRHQESVDADVRAAAFAAMKKIAP